MIHADTNNATAEIGSNAVVSTVGDINLDTRTTANVTVAPTVHTYGLASPGSIDAEATLGEDDQVNVDAGATIPAQGNLNLIAGGDMNGDFNDLTMGSNAYELNASADPGLRAHVVLPDRPEQHDQHGRRRGARGGRATPT